MEAGSSSIAPGSGSCQEEELFAPHWTASSSNKFLYFARSPKEKDENFLLLRPQFDKIFYCPLSFWGYFPELYWIQKTGSTHSGMTNFQEKKKFTRYLFFIYFFCKIKLIFFVLLSSSKDAERFPELSLLYFLVNGYAQDSHEKHHVTGRRRETMRQVDPNLLDARSLEISRKNASDLASGELNIAICDERKWMFLFRGIVMKI